MPECTCQNFHGLLAHFIVFLQDTAHALSRSSYNGQVKQYRSFFPRILSQSKAVVMLAVLSVDIH